MKVLWNFFTSNWDKIMLILVGFIAILVYKIQKHDERRSAAILIIMQIDDLKDKLFSIIEIINNNKLDSIGIYETLDFLEENQWNRYKHLFVGMIDTSSLRTIDDFYTSFSLIREQLVLAKKLQQQSFFNNQYFLGQDCNTYVLKMLDNNHNIGNAEMKSALKSVIEENNSQGIKDLILKQLNSQNTFNMNTKQVVNEFNIKTNELKDVYRNQGVFVSYLPDQIRVTIEKELSKLSHIEIIGTQGYKKIKKIARIK